MGGGIWRKYRPVLLRVGGIFKTGKILKKENEKRKEERGKIEVERVK
jgi:hypothetical protein